MKRAYLLVLALLVLAEVCIPVGAQDLTGNVGGAVFTLDHIPNGQIIYNDTPDALTFIHTTLVDGSPLSATFVGPNVMSTSWGTGTTAANSQVLFTYTKNSTNILKGKIVLNSSHTIAFPYTLPAKENIIQSNGGFLILGPSPVANVYGAVTGRIVIPAPTAIDASGTSVTVSYSLSPTVISLNIPSNNTQGNALTYPVTIDPSYFISGSDTATIPISSWISNVTPNPLSNSCATYQFTEGVGTNAFDFSGNNNTGTFSTNLQWQAGGGLMSPGTDYVHLGSPATLNIGTGDMTVIVVFSSPNAYQASSLIQSGNTSTHVDFNLALRGAAAPANPVRWSTNPNGTYQDIVPALTLQNNTPILLVGTATNGNLVLYNDTHPNSTGQTSGALTRVFGPVNIGFGSSGTANGTYYYAALYNKGINQSQFTQLYTYLQWYLSQRGINLQNQNAPLYTSGTSPLTAQFTDQSASNITGASYNWTIRPLGGSVSIFSSSRNPVYTFQTGGNYTITENVSNSLGGSYSQAWINVTQGVPAVSYMASPATNTTNAPFIATFTDTTTNYPTNWGWVINGSALTTTQNASYLFSASLGSQTIWVNHTASNNGGSGGWINNTYTALSPVVASYIISNTTGTSSLIVNFTDTSTNSPTSWQWGFKNVTGNNTWTNFATTQNPTITFGVGNFLTNLTVSNVGGSSTFQNASWINVTPSVIIGGFSGTPLSGTVPLTVAFTDTSSNATGWNYTFGEGNFSTSQNPVFTYNIPGTYTVVQTATNTGGSTPTITTKTNYITVSPMVATASGTPGTGPAPLSVTFTGSSTGTPDAWLWIFGDSATSTLQNPSHTYSNTGNYTVNFSATNTSSGAKAWNNLTQINVTLITPSASFTATPTSGSAPLAVQFNDTSGYAPTAWTWNFGDGNLTGNSLQNPAHLYTGKGFFNVTLTATNSAGSNTTTYTNYIKIGTFSGTFNDSSVYATAITTYGNASLSPSKIYLGNSSGYFDGLSSYLTLPNASVLALGQRYTISDWVYTTTATGTHVVLAKPAGSYGLLIQQEGTSYKLYESSGTSSYDIVNGGIIGTVVPNTWQQIVVKANGTYINAYLSGTMGSGFPVATTAIPAISASLWYIGATTGGTNLFQGYMDELAIWNRESQPIASLYPQSTEFESMGGVPLASFTNSTVSTNIPVTVQFTDTSIIPPNNWLWNFGDGSTSTLQNPSHTYTTAGTYTVTETTGNMVGYSSTSTTITTTVGMPYASFTESPTGGSPGVLVAFTDTSVKGTSSGLTYNWSFGDTAGTTPYSSTVGSVTHVYAYAQIATPVLTITNANGTSTFTGPPITVSVNQSIANTNVVFSAQMYRFIFQNLQGGRLSNISIVISPMNYTMPAAWINQLYGISSLVNLTSGEIFGTTGSDGSFGAPMITTLEYQVNISGLAGDGETVPLLTLTEYPPSVGGDIIISVPTVQHPAISITPTPAFISYNIYNQSVNGTANNLSVNYYDPTGGTNLTIVTVVNQSGYILSQTTYTGTSADNIADNYTYIQTSQNDVLSFGFSAYNSNAGGWNNVSQPLSFNTGTSMLGSVIPTAYDGWIAVILMVFIPAAFTASSVYFGVIGVGFMGEFFYHVTQWFTPAIGGTAFDAMCIFWIVIGIIGVLTKRSRQVY